MNKDLEKLKRIGDTEKKLELKLGKSFIKKMYDDISPRILAKAMKDAKYVIANKKTELSDYGDFINSTYNRQSALFGYTDYKDHRNDTIEDIKKMLKEEKAFTNPNRTMQKLHYYNVNGKIFDICLIKLSNTGWSIYPGWSDNGIGFANRHN